MVGLLGLLLIPALVLFGEVLLKILYSLFGDRLLGVLRLGDLLLETPI